MHRFNITYNLMLFYDFELQLKGIMDEECTQLQLKVLRMSLNTFKMAETLRKRLDSYAPEQDGASPCEWVKNNVVCGSNNDIDQDVKEYIYDNTDLNLCFYLDKDVIGIDEICSWN